VVHSFEGLAERLLHAGLPGLTPRLVESADELAATEREEAERLALEGQELARAAGFDSEPLVAVQGANAWHTILATAGKHAACAIVAGSRGRSGVATALLGSVSLGLLHHSTVPVLIVPTEASVEASGERALLCYDDSAPSRQAIEQAATLLSGNDALVLHLWESWLARTHGGLAAAVARGMARELDGIATERSSQIATRGLAWAKECGWAAEPLSARCEESLWRCVLHMGEENEASTIVVARRGLSGVSSVLGSVSHGVVHHARRPVLVVPS
jgi:nucleotide-binding universal stress UspA family protein